MTTAQLTISDGRQLAVEVTLRPDPACPIAILMDISTPDGEQLGNWWVSRDLLDVGRQHRVGLADVIVRPGPAGDVLVHLAGQDAHGCEAAAVLTLPLGRVVAVLAECRRHAPRDVERRMLGVAVDAVIAGCRP